MLINIECRDAVAAPLTLDDNARTLDKRLATRGRRPGRRDLLDCEKERVQARAAGTHQGTIGRR